MKKTTEKRFHIFRTNPAGFHIFGIIRIFFNGSSLQPIEIFMVKIIYSNGKSFAKMFVRGA